MHDLLSKFTLYSIFGVRGSTKQPRKAGPDVGVYLKLRSLFLCFPLLLHFTIIPVPRKYTHAIHWLLFISQKGHSVCDVWNLGESSFHSLLSSLDGCSVSVLLGPLAFLL